MREVVSVSLGSSKRDHQVEVELLGEKFNISRVGTNGSFKKAFELLKELDGKVDAIGLGGIDIFLRAGDQSYEILDGLILCSVVRETPVVDGSGLKNTLEREVVNYLKEELNLSLCDKTVLMTSAVDRFGMAEALTDSGCKMIFGDLIFGLKIPIPIRSYSTFIKLAQILLPFVTKMPFSILYPTGTKQDGKVKSRYQKYYKEADIIAGDYLYIKRYIPDDMTEKIILTNTVTQEDIEDLKNRGVQMVITTTPEFQGRSFGTNVLEAAFVVLLDKPWQEITPEEYINLFKKLNFKPRIEKLN